MVMSVRLFCFLPLDRLPLEEAIDREDARPSPIRLPEGWQTVNGLAFGVDRFASALGVLTPVRTSKEASDTAPV
jgi:hypothetical protein